MRQALTDQDPDLEWYLIDGPVVMRERGTIAGVLNQLECGGRIEGGNLDAAGSYIHPFTDLQLGTGKCLTGEIEKFRWLDRAWGACSQASRNLLRLRHTSPPAAARSDTGYGAKDRWVKGSDHREGQHGNHRTGTDGQLGVAVGSDALGVTYGLAAVAIQLSPNPAELLIACHTPEPLHGPGKRAGTINREEANRRKKLIRDAKSRAQEQLAPAWAEWFESKEGADPMRTNIQRNPNWKPEGAVALDTQPGLTREQLRVEATRALRKLRQSEAAE